MQFNARAKPETVEALYAIADRQGWAPMLAAKKANADRFAESVAPIIAEARSAGATTPVAV